MRNSNNQSENSHYKKARGVFFEIHFPSEQVGKEFDEFLRINVIRLVNMSRDNTFISGFVPFDKVSIIENWLREHKIECFDHKESLAMG